MSNEALFHMWEPFRESLIAGHLFYVEQAQKRLVSQFDDMEAEADRAVEEWLEKHSHRFDSDRHDPGDFYEAACEASIDFCQLLIDMREQVLLSITAGIYHRWDKQLRDWLVTEIWHWHPGDTITEKIWSADFGKIADLLECLCWKGRSDEYFRKLDACRLVVNVYKHGVGTSLGDLRRKYPEYLDRAVSASSEPLVGPFLDHRCLKVSDVQFQEFSDAIVAFWKALPEYVVASDISSVPGWFEKSIMSDCVSCEEVSDE